MVKVTQKNKRAPLDYTESSFSPQFFSNTGQVHGPKKPIRMPWMPKVTHLLTFSNCLKLASRHF